MTALGSKPFPGLGTGNNSLLNYRVNTKYTQFAAVWGSSRKPRGFMGFLKSIRNEEYFAS